MYYIDIKVGLYLIVIASSNFQCIAQNGWFYRLKIAYTSKESNRKTMNRNWSNQKANLAIKTKAGNK